MELGENGKTEKLRKFEKIEIIPKNRFFGGWHFRPLKTRRKNKSWIFFNSDRVNSISMLQSAPKLLSNLIKYSFQWQRNDFKYSSWNSWIFVMFDKKVRFTESKFWTTNTKTIMVFRKLDNSKDDHYQILVWYFRLFYGRIDRIKNQYLSDFILFWYRGTFYHHFNRKISNSVLFGIDFGSYSKISMISNI